MDAPEGSPDWLAVATAAERPDLWQRARGRTIPFRWDGPLDDLPPGIGAGCCG